MRLLPAEGAIFTISAVLALANQGIIWAKGIGTSFDHHVTPWLFALAFFAIGQILRGTLSWRIGNIFHVLAVVTCFGAQANDLIFLSLPMRSEPIDGLLVQMDAALGHSWPAWCAWLAQYPTFNIVVQWVYFAGVPGGLLAMMWLSWADDRQQLQQFELATVLGLLVTIGCWNVLPSGGASAYWTLDPKIHEMIQPMVDSAFGVHIVELMREGIDQLGVDVNGGLIGFPSFHTTFGLLTMLALWPYRPARFVVSVAAPVVAIAIVTHGGHSLMDLLGGAVVGFTVWSASGRFLRRVPSLFVSPAQRTIPGAQLA